MPTPTLKRVLLAAALAGTAGCATAQHAAPTVAEAPAQQQQPATAAAPDAASFEAVRYEGPDGTPWPVRRVELPGVAGAHGLPQAPRVAVVELPATGERRGTLLFLHGLGSNLKFWRYQLDAFAAQGWRVVAVDLVGYGRSDKPADFAYTMEAQAEAVHEVARALGLEKPVLVGHSMGGQTALAYAQAHPEHVGALVLTAPAGFETFTAPEKAALKGAYTVERITGATEADVHKSVRLANFARWRPELEWLVEERLRVAKAPDFPAYALANVKSVAGLAENDGVREGLGRVKAPTLIVYGENDFLIPNRFLHPKLTTADVMAVGERGIPGAQRVGLAGCGHAVQLDCPAEYNAAVSRFLDQAR